MICESSLSSFFVIANECSAAMVISSFCLKENAKGCYSNIFLLELMIMYVYKDWLLIIYYFSDNGGIKCEIAALSEETIATSDCESWSRTGGEKY